MEITGVVALAIPSTAALGAVLLTCGMAGAVGTHLFLIGGSPIGAAVILALSLSILRFRRGELQHRFR